MVERKLNLRNMNLKHIEGEVYQFQGIQIDMTNCGCEQLQILKHIASKLVDMIYKHALDTEQLKDAIAFIESKELGEEFSDWLHEHDAEKSS